MKLKPRIPYSAGECEPDVKRICVAPTAAHCMSAIVFGGTTPIYVYRTLRQVYATEAWDVSDSKITQEHFILTPTRFEFVSTISDAWVEKQCSKGMFDVRGAEPDCIQERVSKEPTMYEQQLEQKKGLVRAATRLDRRLGVIAASNSRFHFEGISKIKGPKSESFNYELDILGLGSSPRIILEPLSSF